MSEIKRTPPPPPPKPKPKAGPKPASKAPKLTPAPAKAPAARSKAPAAAGGGHEGKKNDPNATVEISAPTRQIVTTALSKSEAGQRANRALNLHDTGKHVGNMIDAAAAIAGGDLAGGGIQMAQATEGLGYNVNAAAGLTNDLAGNGKVAQGAQAVQGVLSAPLGGLSTLTGAVSVASSSARVVDGAKDLMAGRTKEGALDVAGGAAGALQGVGAVGDGVSTLARAANVTAGSSRVVALANQASGVLGLAGKLGPGLGVVAGSVQAGVALTKTPPDYQKAATGAVSTAGAALMFVPGAQPVALAMIAGAAVVDNWGAISSFGQKAMDTVGGAAQKVAANLA
jgi:hypothetical protein